jgi:RNA polymerase sigma-70 factor (ECF subfamily)
MLCSYIHPSTPAGFALAVGSDRFIGAKSVEKRTNDFVRSHVWMDVNGNLAIVTDLIHSEEAPASGSRLGRLFDRAHQRLYRLGCRMTSDPDEARDLVQETFLRAATRPESLPETDEAAEAWLVRVLVNLCKDGYRKADVRTRLAHHLREDEASGDPESPMVARDLARMLLAALPPRRRAVVTLHELEGLSVSEIAKLLRLTQVTVRWHLAVGRREMAARLECEAGPKGGQR